MANAISKKDYRILAEEAGRKALTVEQLINIKLQLSCRKLTTLTPEYITIGVKQVKIFNPQLDLDFEVIHPLDLGRAVEKLAYRGGRKKREKIFADHFYYSEEDGSYYHEYLQLVGNLNPSCTEVCKKKCNKFFSIKKS